MRYSIENEQIILTADTLGAELVSVRNRATGEEMMWSGDPAVWGRHAPILWPYPGKLWKGEYELDGERFAGKSHGFARDMEFTHLDTPSDRLEFSLRWNEETLSRFPRKFCMTVIFTLSGNTVRQQVQVENLDTREMKFGLGYHPAFVIPFDEKHKTEDYEIRFDTPQTPMVVESEGGFVTGKSHPLMEKNSAIPLNDRIFDNDSIGMAELTAKTISLTEKDTGRNITVEIGGFPYVLIWSMPGDPKLRYVCLEPWHNTQDKVDSPADWNQKPGAACVRPGENWSSRLNITFDR